MKKHAVFRSLIDPILLLGVPFKFLMVTMGLVVMLVLTPARWFAPLIMILAYTYAKVQQRKDQRWMMIISRRLKLKQPAFVSGKRKYLA